ncbi:MAG: ABC-ATPase domain-containing protein [Hespellia sp.]|nr:ABC-ATPase domain-containing protein [Hespellia sp.]
MRKLEQLLRQVDGKSYPAYKSLRGTYDFREYSLNIEHVQGDPFAAPSKVSVQVNGKKAGFPAWMYDTKEKRIALQDMLLRAFWSQTGKYTRRAKGSGKSGVISVSRCGQEVLERSGCEIKQTDGSVTVRLEIGFPANGRRIQAGELNKILFDYLPDCVKHALYYANMNQKKLEEAVFLAEDRVALGQLLKEKKLAAFVANGSVLPRESSVLDAPMKQAVPFQSPKELEVLLELPHKKTIKGMGIPKGVTLIVGGGYHGKSTLLQALEKAVYPHIPGDGREYVMTEESAVKLRAEDGRNVCSVDISAFIRQLPNGKDTTSFSTMDASGSTSQASNLAEAISCGSKILLIDEDTSATNFMVRDELMQRVVHRDKEPIIPYVERVRELYEKFGISTVLVAGSSGAYFQVADTIIQMDMYEPYVITERAKEEASHFQGLKCDAEKIHGIHQTRVPIFKAERNDRTKIKGLGKDGFLINKEEVELRFIEQIVDGEQTQLLGYILEYLKEHVFDGKKNLDTCVDEVYQLLQEKGIQALFAKGSVPGNLAMPRKEEISASVNRYRGLQI